MHGSAFSGLTENTFEGNCPLGARRVKFPIIEQSRGVH